MSLSQIHLHLGRIAEDSGDFETSIGHLLLAFADTPYFDEQAEIMLEIANTFNNKGQYRSALAVLEEANLIRKYFSPAGLPNSRSLQVLVMECILKTNMEHYRDSLERGLEIADSWGNEDIANSHQSIINSFVKNGPDSNQLIQTCLEIFGERLLSKFAEIEQSAKFDGIVAKKKKLLNMIRALTDNTVANILNAALSSRTQQHTFKETDDLRLDIVLTSQVLTEMYNDILRFIVQQCEWMNNRAFNFCEMDLILKKRKVTH